ncbi:hypothetical protein WJX84_001941 [Apatococcus fuscideae]|uniref:Ketoreductase domain-containing protein n=1 Tax=Apatococcus fuscideae TaxID=2026836 RepID=A0AAW1SZ28_9CHLO
MQLGNYCSRFQNLTAVVIGGGSGLGKATCKRLAAEAARVIVADIDVETAQAVAAAIQETGGSSEAAQVDVTQEKAVQQFFKGPGRDVDVLINSAGTMWTKSFEDLTLPDLQEAFGPNINGLLYAMQQASLAMRAQSKPEASKRAIVNISSTAALASMPGLTAYSAAKAAIRQLSRSAAVELAPFNVRVNTVLPHGTDTEGVRGFAAQLPPELQAVFAEVNMPKLIPRLAQPEEIAAGIAFLASSDASFLTAVSLSWMAVSLFS